MPLTPHSSHPNLAPSVPLRLLAMMLALLGGLAITALATPAAASAAKVDVPKRASVSGRTLILPVKNAGADAVRIKVTVKRGGRALGSAGLRLAKKGQRLVRVKLSPALARKVAKGSRLKLAVVIRVRAAGQRTRTIRHAVVAAKKPPAKPKPGGGGPGGPATPSIDGSYHDQDWTMAVEDGVVKGFSGSISTYCSVTKRQKKVYFAMIGDDPLPKEAADGSYSWEATTNYGFVKLKFEGRITNGVARGKMMVEDRSMIYGSGRIEFDYCFAGRDYEMTRAAGATREAGASQEIATTQGAGASRAARSAARKAKPTKKNRKPASAGWRIAKVTLDGWSQHRLVEGGDNFTADGRVRYRTRGPLTGRPVKLERRRPTLAVPLVAQGITWTSTTDARLSTPHNSWGCSHHHPPIKAGLAGAFTVLAKKVRVQWSLAPTLLRCPDGAPKWSFPGLPLKAMTSTFPRSLLKGRVARIPVEIQHNWRDEAGVHEVHWDGTVVLRR